MSEFLDGKRAEQLDPSLDELGDFLELAQLFYFRACRFRRIGDAPVSDRWLAGKDRTGFLRAVANGNDDVEGRTSKLVP